MATHPLLTGRRSHPLEMPALYPSLLKRHGGIDPISGRFGDDFTLADRTSDVLFTPNEDAYSYEVKCLEEIIDARRQDPTQYPEGQNPYQIQYAVYNLRNRRVFDKLAEAHRLGVDVQVLIEADQISPERAHNKVDEWFEEAGMTVIRSDKDVDPEQIRRAHLIGIDAAELMHMKSRILKWRAPSGEMKFKLLTGPLNPGGDPVKNDEHLNVFTEKALVERFSGRFTEVREHRPAVNTWSDEAAVNVLFTPHTRESVTPTQKLFDLIDAENELIMMPIFCLRNLSTRGEQEDLIQKLQNAQARGARVVVMTDMRKSDGQTFKFDDGKIVRDAAGNPVREQVEMYGRPAYDDDTDEKLQAAGIQVLEVVNNRSKHSAMHERFTLFGLREMKVMTSEGNYTKAAMGSRSSMPKNQESYVFIDSARHDDNYTGRAYLGRALQLLRKYDEQYDESAEALIAELQRLDGWPQLKVDPYSLVKADAGEQLDLVLSGPIEQTIKLPSADRPGSFRRRPPLSLPFGAVLTYQTKDARSGALGKQHQILVADAPDHPSPK